MRITYQLNDFIYFHIEYTYLFNRIGFKLSFSQYVFMNTVSLYSIKS